jgi:uncharacterized membrane protein
MLIYLITLIPRTVSADSYALPIDLSFTIFSDGVTSVEYYVEVDPTQVTVQAQLYGLMFEDLLVLDQDGLPLEFIVNESRISVDSLGATNLDISYLTPSMTGKKGAIWIFNASSPITCKIILPPSSTIIYLDPIPLDITQENEKSVLFMPPDLITISYLVDIIDTETQASNLIKEADTTISEALALGIILPEAETLLQQAKSAFNAKDFLEAKLQAKKANDKALEIIEEANNAASQINIARSAINDAIEAGKTVGLEAVESLLEQANIAYYGGEYSSAFELAMQAFHTAKTLERKEEMNPLFLLIGALLLVAIAAGIFRIIRKPSKKPVEIKPVDLEYLFDVHYDLREDDKEVIEFISAKGGQAFAMEIREKFNIPRTSAWRLIKRLQRFEIIDERKIGGQTLVRIKDEYRK